MKIIVSIKQVPDTSGKVAVNPDGTLNRASMQTITNPDDMNALEAALKIKDARHRLPRHRRHHGPRPRRRHAPRGAGHGRGRGGAGLRPGVRRL